MAEGQAGPSNRDVGVKEPNLTDSTAGYVLKITQWSKKRKDKEHGKDDLSADVFCDKVGNQWQLLYNINGNSSVKDDDYLSLFVAIAGREDLPFAWTKHVTFSFTLQHPDDPEDQQNKDGDCEGRKSITSTVKSKVFKGCETTRDWGWSKYQTHQKIEENGFVVDDCVSVLCEISTLSSAYNIEEEDASAYLKLACEKGEVENVEFCLSEVRERWRGKDASEYLLYTYLNTAVDPSKKSSETALDIAISEKHTQVIKKLLQEGARPSVDSIDRAVKKGTEIEVLKSLLDVEFPDDGSKYTFQALITAAKNTCPCCGDPVHSSGMLRLLLEHGADPNLQDKNGNTALVHLAESGLGEEVILMVDEYQASVERCSKDKRKVLKVKHTIKKQRELREENNKALALAGAAVEDEQEKADMAMLALLAEEDAEVERKSAKASKNAKKKKKKAESKQAEKGKKDEPGANGKPSAQEQAKAKEAERAKQRADEKEARRKAEQDEEAAYLAALEEAKAQQKEREAKQQKEILAQIQANEKRQEEQRRMEEQMANMRLEQQRKAATQAAAVKTDKILPPQPRPHAAAAMPAMPSTSAAMSTPSAPPQQKVAAGSNGTRQPPPRSQEPAASVASPNSVDDEFAAIWGAQQGAMDDEDEDEGIAALGLSGGAPMSFAHFQAQQASNFQGAGTEELFWSDGASNHNQASRPAPTTPLPPAPLHGNAQQLFWAPGAGESTPGDAAGSMPQAQWPGGGIFSQPDSQAHTWQEGGHSQFISQGWNLGGGMGFGAFNGHEAESLESNKIVHLEGAGTSPTEYQPQHLIGEALGSLLDD